MELDEIDPEMIAVSEYNERQEDLDKDDEALRELVESVNEIGVVEPVTLRDVHHIDDIDGRYDVVTGQRRVRAARETGQNVPAVIMDWDDEEALVASITENVRTLDQDVSTRDRAMALKRLWNQMGGEGDPDAGALAARLGLSRSTVSLWLEPLREEWLGTDVSPTSGENETLDSVGESDGEANAGTPDGEPTDESDESATTDRPEPSSDSLTDAEEDEESSESDSDEGVDQDPDPPDTEDSDGDESTDASESPEDLLGDFIDEGNRDDGLDLETVSSGKMAIVRRMTGGGEEGVAVLRRVVEDDLSITDLREAAERVDRGDDVGEVLDEIIEQKSEGGVQVPVFLSDDRLERVNRVAEDHGLSRQEVVLEAVDRYLDDASPQWFDSGDAQ